MRREVAGFCASFEQAFDIFREDVALEVHRIAGNHTARIRVLMRERNDGDIGDAVVPARDGQADAVDRDRAFFGNVAAQFVRHAHGEPPILAFAGEARHAPDAVHMALHEMSAQARDCRERPFEIDYVAGFLFAERCAPQRLAGKISAEMLCVEFDHGQAAAVDGDAVAEFHAGCDFVGTGQVHSETAAFGAALERFNFPGAFDDPRKHRENILRRQNQARIACSVKFESAGDFANHCDDNCASGTPRAPMILGA